jgi:hypothetical protein
VTPLIVGMTDYYLRRLVGPRIPARARRPLFVLAIIVLGCVSLGGAWLISGSIRNGVGTTGILLPVIALFGFLIAGPVILAAEGVRDKSGAIERLLASLPLRSWEIRVIVWSPLVLSAILMEVLLVPPVFAAFAGSGLNAADSWSLTWSVIAGGVTAACLALEVAYGLLRGPRWAALRTPSAALIWMGIAVATTWASVQSIAFNGRPPELLPISVVVADSAAGESLPWQLVAEISIVFAVSLALLLPVMSDRRGGEDRPVRVRWSGPVSGSRVIGEFLYAFRFEALVGNLIAAIVINVVMTIAFLQLDARTAATLLVPFCGFVCVSASVAARLPRPIYAVRRTPAQLLGVSLRGWVISQTGVGATCFALAAAPVVVYLIHSSPSQWATIVGLLLCSFGIGHMSSWLVVTPLDNALAQLVAGLVTTVAGSITYFVLTRWTLIEGQPSIGVGMALVLIAFVAAFLAERARWHPTRSRITTHGDIRAEGSTQSRRTA